MVFDQAVFSEFSKNIIPSLKGLISNKEFQNDLDKTGGVVSLIGVGLQIYNTIKKSLETDEDRASNSLIRIVFETAKTALKEASKKYSDGEEIKIEIDLNVKKTILQNIFESFEGYYEDDESFTSLTYLPSILSFKSSLISQLEEKLKQLHIWVNPKVLNNNLLILKSNNNIFGHFHICHVI